MKLASWLRGADAAKEDLETQLEHARAASAKASEATALAREAFDADPSTEPKLRAALETEQGARLHVERAERLLEQAQKAEAARKRAELAARREQLRAQLAPAALEAARAPLADEEAEALHTLAKVRAKRRALESNIADKQTEVYRISDQLGEEAKFAAHAMDRLMFVHRPPQQPVRDRVTALMSKLPPDDHVRRYLDKQLDVMTDGW